MNDLHKWETDEAISSRLTSQSQFHLGTVKRTSAAISRTVNREWQRVSIFPGATLKLRKRGADYCNVRMTKGPLTERQYINLERASKCFHFAFTWRTTFNSRVLNMYPTDKVCRFFRNVWSFFQLHIQKTLQFSLMLPEMLSHISSIYENWVSLCHL